MQFREEPWRPPSSLSEWASPSQVSGIMRQQINGIAQDYAQASQAQNNINAQRVDWSYLREATRADLGIIDHNLDNKIGMEP